VAYNYLGLVNDVNRRLNEVQLSDTNFLTATGFYGQAKEAVNAAIQDINNTQYEWPFNYIEQEELLTVGITRYSFPSDARSVDFDTFRIKEDTLLDNRSQKLKILTYEDYLNRFTDQEYSNNTSKLTVPEFVFRTPGLEFGVAPAPDKAYTIVYDYYTISVDLVNPTDVPLIPEIYRGVIIDGAMYYAYMFRSNEEAANMARRKFLEGIKSMRTILANRYEYVRSTYLPTVRRTSYVYRIGSP
jgi:hypothetical protein